MMNMAKLKKKNNLKILAALPICVGDRQAVACQDFRKNSGVEKERRQSINKENCVRFQIFETALLFIVEA